MKISRTTVTMTASLLLIALASSAGAAASGSVEFMCKAKAKEIAAETYKGCVTENKQVQVERIRKEYQTKLAELKNQYNSELKELAPKKSGKASVGTDDNSSEMPAKKMKSPRLKTEKIDFSSASPATAQNDSTIEVVVPETEIVEIPVQQE